MPPFHSQLTLLPRPHYSMNRKSDRVQANASNDPLDRLIPLDMPFPPSRLHSGIYSFNSNREQLLDPHGSFVLTNIEALPDGGAVRRCHTHERAINIALLGDMGTPNQTRQDILNHVMRAPETLAAPTIIFGLGDWMYPYGPIDNSPQERERMANTVLDSFSDVATIIPTFGVLGNHEYGCHANCADPGVFMDAARVAGIQFPGRYYQLSINGPDWAADCFALDSSTLAGDPQQVAWFQQQVADSVASEQENGSRWRIIMAHHPLTSYGVHYGETAYLIDLLGDALKHVHLYCCGHEHDLEYVQTPRHLPDVLLSGTSSETRPTERGPQTLFSSSDNGYANLLMRGSNLKVTINDAQTNEILFQKRLV